MVAATGCVGVSVRRHAPGPSNPATGQPTDQVVNAALQDVERYWTAEFPKLSGGAPFTPISGGRFPYTQRKPPPACGDQPGEYQPKAFYCPAGDFIAWDAQSPVPQLQSQYGTLLVGVVFAHKYGHAVQARLRLTDQPTIVL